jgi:hypothetical protein
MRTRRWLVCFLIIESSRVKVYVRIRPLNEDEINSKEVIITKTYGDDESELTIIEPGKRDLNFNFDKVFGVKTKNKEIFDAVGKQIVSSALNGFNGTLLAYGQTVTKEI